MGVGCAAACECEQRGIPSVALTSSSSSSVACDEEEGDYEGVCRCGCSLDPTLWLRLRLRPLIIPRSLALTHQTRSPHRLRICI